MIRVLIVDDEAAARRKIVRMLAADARFALAGEAADGVAALALIRELNPDVVILDVQMPGLTGLEVIDAVGPDACPQILFSTAFDQFAVAAFEAAAVDYLLKPYDAGRFQRALDRAAQRIARDPLPRERASVDRLLVKGNDGFVAVRLADVLRITADDKHVRIHVGGAEHVVRHTLRSLESQLDATRFVRVHRSEIVALDAVVKVEPWSHGDALLTLTDGATIVLSRTYREAFLARWRR